MAVDLAVFALIWPQNMCYDLIEIYEDLFSYYFPLLLDLHVSIYFYYICTDALKVCSLAILI